MNWSDALGAAIEVAIGLAGFSGIVAAVGRRGAGDWTQSDQLRLRVLLTASGVAALFAVLPYIALDAGLDPDVFWRLGTAAQVIWFSGIPLYRRRQAARMGASFSVDWRVFFLLYLPVVGILLLNSVVLARSWAYVLGVYVQLTVAFITFVELLLDSWRPPE